MKLTIDNLQGLGPQDYTVAIDGTVAPKVDRRLNAPGKMQLSLMATGSGFVAPTVGARVALVKSSGAVMFTGYLTAAPELEFLGNGERGPVYRYNLVARTDEVILDQKALPNRSPFVERSAGSALRQLAQDLLPGGFETSAVEDVDTIASYTVNPQKTFSYHAAEIAQSVRASYRALNGALTLAPVGAASYALNEEDDVFSPAGLSLQCPNLLANDVTIVGLTEPQAYCRDYFVGDGLSLKFYLAQTPFAQNKGALIDEQYCGVSLDPTTWTVNDATSAISVAGQTLQVAGGNGQTSVSFIEQIELGGALELQHGDVTFSGPSQGVLGGLYAGTIAPSGCMAGFQVTPAGEESNLQALINGAATGPVIATQAEHRYVLTTYLYSMEVYRSQETFHSSQRPAGSGWGGRVVPADLRVVLEVHDIDPAVPASQVAPATVLYDAVITNAAGFCTYTLVNAINLQCGIAYTYAARIPLAEVRTAPPDSSYTTQLVGALSDGAECGISSSSLDFYPQYVPVLNQLIVASYRGSGRAVAEVVDRTSIASLANGNDNGTRGMVRTVKVPSARTAADCENAALAVLDDGAGAAWSGEYQAWSDFLPGGAADIFPGDAIAVNVPMRGAVFTAIVRQVEIEMRDPTNDRGLYAIHFANDLAAPLALQEAATEVSVPLYDLPARQARSQVGNYYLDSLRAAQITAVTSASVTVDTGVSLASGCGVEVRAHDYGWGPANDRNLVGRFTTQTFSLPRLARTQNYFLRIYDGGSPPRYSRYSAALHVDYPLG